MRKWKAWIIASVILLGFLIIGNPSEQQFLSRVATDFGDMHHGMSLSVEQLAVMGESHYRSYLVGSLYDYRFGNIQVTYLGIAFFKYYLGSSTSQPANQQNPVKSA